jgi:stage II sporulation protein AA (anti-sigma F factor antagonist)
LKDISKKSRIHIKKTRGKRSMNISFDIVKNSLVVALKGELDHHCSDFVKQSIEGKIKEEGVVNIILDMEDVSFMDSSGIGVILGRYRNITSLGGKMAVVGIKGNAKKIYEMSGLGTIIGCYNDVAAALSIT